MVSRTDYLQRHKFDPEPDHDFYVEGKPPQWASGHPKEWGRENTGFHLPFNVECNTRFPYLNLRSAISPDNELLAISFEGKILIYDVHSKELRQELDGLSEVAFRPSLPKPRDEEAAAEGRPYYTLVSKGLVNTPSEPFSKTAIFWELDRNGRLLDQEEPLDASEFASKAIEGIEKELRYRHEYSKEFIDSSELHEDFRKALEKLSATHRIKHNTVFTNVSLPPMPFSSNGSKFIYRHMNKTTQHGMREPDKLPVVVVWDIESAKEDFRLAGHTDMIVSAQFSPNSQYIATTSLDGTMQMYDGASGHFLWKANNEGHQSSKAEFSPDSSVIVWCHRVGEPPIVYRVADGTQVSRFPEKMARSQGIFAWHPDGRQLALAAERTVYIWNPMDGNDGNITQTYEIKGSKEFGGFLTVSSLQWMDEGVKLAISFGDGTNLVWDSSTNTKEIFKRPRGRLTTFPNTGFYRVRRDVERDLYISVDGDGWVRYYQTSVPTFPSWWENEQSAKKDTMQENNLQATGDFNREEQEPGWWEKKPERPSHPATGKYVNVLKNVGPKINKENLKKMREDMATQGAGLWTAE